MLSRSLSLPTLARARGFTVVELLVAMACAAILAAIALPAMRQFMQNQQDSTAASQLVTMLNYARSEAIKEDLAATGGNGVELCASTGAGTPASCDTTNWANGWIVLSTKAGVPTVFQQAGALPTGVTVTTTPANSAVIYQPNGTTTTALVVGAVTSRVMFRLCDSRGAPFAREIEVAQSGIIQASSTPGKDVSGAALVCP